MFLSINVYRMAIGLLSITLSYGQTNHEYTFKTLTLQDGLSNSDITDITQDSTGYVWLSTQNGLNRYDGTEITVFKHILGDTTSLLDNRISQVFYDSHHRLWLVTASGISRYRPVSNDFKSYPTRTFTDIPRNSPLGIAESSAGQLLVLLHNNEVALYSERDDRFRRHLRINSEVATQTMCAYQDKLFLGGRSHLLEVSLLTGDLVSSRKLSTEARSLSSGITQLTVINDQLWITGLEIYPHCLDLTTRTIERIDSLPPTTLVTPLSEQVLLTSSKLGTLLYHTVTQQTLSLRSVDHQDFLNNTYNVFVDRDSNLWMASYQRGVIYSSGPRVFRDIRHLSEELVPYVNDISSLQVIDNQLWMGLNTGRVVVEDLETHQYELFYDDTLATLPGEGTVFSITEDRRGSVWVGSYQGGLCRYDSASGRFVRSQATVDSLRIRSNDIRSIVEDDQGMLWLAVHGKGVDVYDPQHQVVVASHGLSAGDTDPYIGDWTKQLAITPDRTVWIASSSGLQMINGATKKFFQHDADDPRSLSSDKLTDLLVDSRGNLWIGTAEGLNVLNPADSSFTKFTTQQGLNDNYVSSLIEDASGTLWVGTYDGLSCLSYQDVPHTATVQNIELPPGLYSNQFVERASTIDTAGNVYFATTYGLLIFNPKDLPPVKNDLPVILTNLTVFSEKNTEPVISSENHTLYRPERIQLPPDENTVSVSFTAINFTHSGTIHYHYRLRGYDKQWLTTTDQSVMYHDLPPGEYEFVVKASSNNADVSVGESLPIVIASPWYNTLGGRIAIGLATFTVILLGIYALLERIRLKNHTRLSEKEHEVDQLKIKFFMNISHEFRTPLSLILGPLEELIHSAEPLRAQQYFQLIQRNAQRLSQLVDQLLDLRQLEQKCYQLRVAEGSLIALSHEVYESFWYLAEQRGIDYQFCDDTETDQYWFDADIIDKVLYNLLSNAFKYTADGGSVNVSVTGQPDAPGWTTIEVADTGKGIATDQIDYIFDRFYQVDSPNHQGGSGIGLSLCRELIQLHRGRITVNSIPGQGSIFTVTIPTQSSYYTAGDLRWQKQENHYSVVSNSTYIFPNDEESTSDSLSESEDQKPLVLVVDDQADLRLFVRRRASDEFKIITAKNGQEAFQKAVNTIPDVIVSDVMMPVMDGLRLAKLLKEDLRTSHIPIVLLTARASEEDQIKGLNLGVDDYVPKPFRVEVLMAKLRSLVANRAKLEELFTKSDWTTVRKRVSESSDSTFLQQVTNVIDENMDNPSLSTDTICKAVGMSRSQLYRKLPAVTGKSVHEFIKQCRLAKAAELLGINHITVAEVASQTGFKYVQGFTRSFKKHYGYTPSQYAKRDTLRC